MEYVIMAVAGIVLIVWLFALGERVKANTKSVVEIITEQMLLNERDNDMEKHKHLRGKVVLPARDNDTN